MTAMPTTPSLPTTPAGSAPPSRQQEQQGQQERQEQRRREHGPRCYWDLRECRWVCRPDTTVTEC